MSTVGTVLIQFRNVRIVAEGAADVTFQSHTIQGADPLKRGRPNVMKTYVGDMREVGRGVPS